MNIIRNKLSNCSFFLLLITRVVILSTATTVVLHLGIQYNKLCRFVLSCDYTADLCDLCNPKSSHCLRPSTRRNFHGVIFLDNCTWGSMPGYCPPWFNPSDKPCTLHSSSHLWLSGKKVPEVWWEYINSFGFFDSWDRLNSQLPSICFGDYPIWYCWGYFRYRNQEKFTSQEKGKSRPDLVKFTVYVNKKCPLYLNQPIDPHLPVLFSPAAILELMQRFFIQPCYLKFFLVGSASKV